jgi:hypothetical protein
VRMDFSKSILFENGIRSYDANGLRRLLDINRLVKHRLTWVRLLRVQFSANSKVHLSKRADQIRGCKPKPPKIPSKWVSGSYRLMQSSLVDVGIQRNVTRIAQYFSDFSDREPIAQ